MWTVRNRNTRFTVFTGLQCSTCTYNCFHFIWNIALRKKRLQIRKHKKAICKLCEGVTLAYAGGTSNLFNHLEAKHPVAYTKAVPKECSRQKQTTLGTFATACPPARANRITTLIAECVARDSDTTVCMSEL